MRRTSLLALLTASLVLLDAPQVCVAAEPAFTVVVDGLFYRPILRRTPPKDDNDERPLDVVQKFLKAINDEDYAAAEERCSFQQNTFGIVAESVRGEDFKRFCETVRGHMKSVTLSGSSIPSGSSNSDRDYWSVRYKFTPATNGYDGGYFCMLQIDGVWKILQKPHWHSVAMGEDRTPMW